MKLDILCPKCHSVIGEMDGFQQEYYNHNGYGQPMCKNCGTSERYFKKPLIIIFGIITTLIVIALTLSLV